RRTMELDHFKWDAQVGDVAALAPFPLWIDAADWAELAAIAERLATEVIAFEREVAARPELVREIGVPRPLRDCMAEREGPRVMRFDFHPTRDGWRISEGNSDVPGGLTEATNFTQLVAAAAGGTPTGDPTRAVVDAIARSGAERVALTDAPGHMEDHQVVAHLAARLCERGIDARVLPPEFAAREPAIVRFYPIDWLVTVPHWQQLFARTVMNPAACAISESNRAPLVW